MVQVLNLLRPIRRGGSMDSSILNLGYTVRRAIRDNRDGLHVFSHDLGTFCISEKYALLLANAYKRYLCAAGILDWRDHLEGDEKLDAKCLYDGDRNALAFIQERRGVVADHQSLDGLFHLEEAIEFVETETDLQKALVIRWCMMMEYITYEDQRLSVVHQANADSKSTRSAQENTNEFKKEEIEHGV